MSSVCLERVRYVAQVVLFCLPCNVLGKQCSLLSHFLLILFHFVSFFSYCKKRGLCYLIWGWLTLGEPLARKKKLIGEKNAIKLICYVAMTYNVVNALMNLPLKHELNFFLWRLVLAVDYVLRSASSWVHSIYNSSSFVGLTFSIGGEQLFGLGWDKLRMYNVADRLGLTGWI